MNATIYTINTCNFCKSAKDFFTSKNIPFTEKNVEQDKAALDEMLKLSDNFAGVPFTIITKDDGTTVSLKGFTLQEFEHATSGGMDMSTPNIPTVPNIPIETVPVEVAPVVEPTPTIVEPMSPMPLNTPAEPVSTPEPTTPAVVEPVAETPPAVEPIPTPEPIAETPASNAVDMDLNTPATSNVADNVPTTPTLPNSPAPDDDVDKKLDTLLQSLQSKTTESTSEPVEAPATVEPVSAPISQMPLNTPAEPMSTPTQDTNINNPLYQAAEPVPSVEPAPQMAPISLNTPTEAPTPMDTPAPAVTTEATPSIPDFKPKM